MWFELTRGTQVTYSYDAKGRAGKDRPNQCVSDFTNVDAHGIKGEFATYNDERGSMGTSLKLIKRLFGRGRIKRKTKSIKTSCCRCGFQGFEKEGRKRFQHRFACVTRA